MHWSPLHLIAVLALAGALATASGAAAKTVQWQPIPRHQLEVHTRRGADGGLAVAVYTDGSLLRRARVPAALAAGLAGPIGVRSDNGDHLFRLSSLP